MWQRPLRAALALCVVGFGVVVGLGVRERTAPEATVALYGADPDAILQSRGARITLGDGTVIEADQQFAYADGRSRLVTVEVAVPEDDDRIGLRIRGGEATGSQDEGHWTLSVHVEIETDDGLTAATDEASYDDGEGIVRMPGPARFEQGWMTLTGGESRYDRRHGLLHLDRQARVQLRTGDNDEGETRIEAASALIARADGYMRFEGNVAIDTGYERMDADEGMVTFDPEESRLDRVDLTGDARIEGRDPTPGGLRALTAQAITVSYLDGAIDRAVVRGGGRVALYGATRDEGAAIGGGTVDLRFGGDTDAGGVDHVAARDGVTLDLPAADGRGRRVRADALDLGLAESANQVTMVHFDGAVEFREQVDAGSDTPTERIVRAERLAAALHDDVTRLGEARFDGGVTLEAGAVKGVADAATYMPDAATLVLHTAEAGNPPRVVDHWGSIQGATVTVRLDGPDVEAVETVRGILELDGNRADDGLTRPGLFDEGSPIYATAERFAYVAESSRATYAGGARLWQGETEIRAGTITLHEASGNLEAVEDVTTRTTMVRQDHDTGEAAPTTAVSRGAAFRYDNSARQVSYLGEATLDSGGIDLAAGTIVLRLADDARTLEGIETADDVQLRLDDRRAAGETLAYEDAGGRYDMTGAPVRIIEEMGGGCRETTGRAVTFYVTGDAVIVDGGAEARTASSTSPCQPF